MLCRECFGQHHSSIFCIFAGKNSAKLTAPPGSVVTGHKSQSGWQNVDTFLMWMKHFVEYAKPSESQPVLLNLDNCSSHVDVSIIDYAKEHHIMLLSITKCHVIPSIVSYAFPLAFTPSNIAAGFRKTDIYPLDRNAITLMNICKLMERRVFLPDPEEMDPTEETVLVKNTSSPDIQIGVFRLT